MEVDDDRGRGHARPYNADDVAVVAVAEVADLGHGPSSEPTATTVCTNAFKRVSPEHQSR